MEGDHRLIMQYSLSFSVPAFTHPTEPSVT
jgi:hypothetical protein